MKMIDPPDRFVLKNVDPPSGIIVDPPGGICVDPPDPN